MLKYFKSPYALKKAIENCIDGVLNYAVQTVVSRNLGLVSIQIFLIFTLAPCFLGIYYLGGRIEIPADELGSLFGTKFFQLVPIIVLITLCVDIFLSFFTYDIFYKTLFSFLFGMFYFASSMSNKFNFLNENVMWLAFLLVNFLNIFIVLISENLSFKFRFPLLFILELILLYCSQFFLYPWLRNSFMALQLFRYIFIYSSLFESPSIFKKTSVNKAKDFICYILNPGFLITPIPIRFNKSWEQVAEVEKLVKLKFKSALFLLFTALLILMAFLLDDLKFELSQYLNKSEKKLYLGPINYLYYFAFSYSNINVVVCLAWWLGRDIPNAYSMPLLAVSPQDRWRRWNTYFYDWLFRFVYYPMVKLTKSQFVSIIAVFSITMTFHIGGKADFDKTSAAIFDKGLGPKFLFFLAHGFAVYLGVKFSKYGFDERKASGWFGVIAMFILMSLIHSILL